MHFRSKPLLYFFLCIISIIASFLINFGNCELSLTLLHTNDVHSRFEQVDAYGLPCTKEAAEANKCFGGFPRLYQKAEEIRSTHPNVIYLNGGDFFQGTVWYTLFRWEVVAHFVNKLKHTAMALGNHEFDDNIDGLVPFLENISFPVLSCNIDDTNEPKLQGKYNKSIIVEYDGVKVGIIGYTTPETMDISNPGKLIFKNISQSVTEEAKRLYENENVKIIFAVGHAGFEVDLELANIPYLDFVVGGHTNTFQYTGTPPSNDIPEAPYPSIVVQPNGRKVPVVQAHAYGKYLGYLNLKFDDNGELTSWEGNPILLDGSVPQDKDLLADVNEWSKKVQSKVETEIGRTRVFLDGTRTSCRLGECNLGNVITDAMVFKNMKDHVNDQWSDVSMAIVHSGSIRASISEKERNGSIVLENLLLVSPFGHSVDAIEIKGEYLRKTFEYSVDGFDPNYHDPSGKFLQVSGIRIVYDITKPSGNRVKKLDVLCQKCRVPEYVPLNDTAIYKIIVPGYLVEGGNGYDVLKKHTIAHYTSGELDLDILLPYFKIKSPITQGLEGRISFETDESISRKCNASLNKLNLTSGNNGTMSQAEVKLRQKIQKYLKELEELQSQAPQSSSFNAVSIPRQISNSSERTVQVKATSSVLSSSSSSEEDDDEKEESTNNNNIRKRRSIILTTIVRNFD